MQRKYNIHFNDVDFSKLNTEEDYEREADRLLPRVVSHLGSMAGETAWDTMAADLKKMGATVSNSQRSAFVAEASQSYAEQVTDEDRAEFKSTLINDLKAAKPAS